MKKGAWIYVVGVSVLSLALVAGFILFISDLDRQLAEIKGELDEARTHLAESAEQLANTQAQLETTTAERDLAFAERDEARTGRDAAIAERDALQTELAIAKDSLKERDRQLTDTRKELESVKTEPDEALAERDAAVMERDALQTEFATAKDSLKERDRQLEETQQELESVKTKRDEALAERDAARKQLVGDRNLRVLHGALEERNVLISVYSASDTIELEAGNWAFVPGDIGGLDTTRAGEASVTYTVIPSSCIRELEGDWPGALALDCPATVEWTVESRYPHFLLNILPLADSITVPEEVEATQDE